MEIDELTKLWENELKELREQCADLRHQYKETQWQLMAANSRAEFHENAFNQLIENSEPLYKELLARFQAKVLRVGELERTISAKDEEITKLKVENSSLKLELEKVHKWDTDHLTYLIEAIRKQPLEVVIVSNQEEQT